MKQLMDGIQYDNPYLSVEFGDYLLANGYKCNYQGRVLFFRKANRRVQITNQNIDVFLHYPELDTKIESEKWIFDQSFFGYRSMTFFQWIMLMDSMNIVKINDFINAASGDDKQLKLENRKTVEFLVHTQMFQYAKVG